MKLRRVEIHPNEIKEDDYIVAHLPDGSIECGFAIPEVPLVHAKSKHRLGLHTEADGVVCDYSDGHILTDAAGFPDGTIFYRIEAVPMSIDEMQAEIIRQTGLAMYEEFKRVRA